MALTSKQQIFVDEYLKDLCGKQAAIRAGYSPKTAEVIAHQLLKKTSVSAAVELAISLRQKRTVISQDMVIQELASVAFARISDVVEIEKGQIKIRNSSGIHGENFSGVRALNQSSNGITISMHDKLSALKLLGAHLGLFAEKNEKNEDKDSPFDCNRILEILGKIKDRPKPTSAPSYSDEA